MRNQLLTILLLSISTTVVHGDSKGESTSSTMSALQGHQAEEPVTNEMKARRICAAMAKGRQEDKGFLRGCENGVEFAKKSAGQTDPLASAQKECKSVRDFNLPEACRKGAALFLDNSKVSLSGEAFQDLLASMQCSARFDDYYFGKGKLLKGCEAGLAIAKKHLASDDAFKKSLNECDKLQDPNKVSGCVEAVSARLPHDKKWTPSKRESEVAAKANAPRAQ